MGGGAFQSGLWEAWERHLTNATNGVKDGLDCRGPLARSHPSNVAVDDARLSHLLPLGKSRQSVISVSPSETGLMIPASSGTWNVEMEVCTDAARPSQARETPVGLI